MRRVGDSGKELGLAFGQTIGNKGFQVKPRKGDDVAVVLETARVGQGDIAVNRPAFHQAVDGTNSAASQGLGEIGFGHPAGFAEVVQG